MGIIRLTNITGKEQIIQIVGIMSKIQITQIVFKMQIIQIMELAQITQLVAMRLMPQLVPMAFIYKIGIIIFPNNLANTLRPNLGPLLPTQYPSAMYVTPRSIAITDTTTKTPNKITTSR